MASHTKDIDLGYKEVLKQIEVMKSRPYVKVGIQEGTEAYPDGTKTVDVATIHEFGGSGGKPPQRSFIRTAVDENRSELTNLTETLLIQVSYGNIDVDKALQRLGIVIKAAIQKKITDLDTPPLALSTKERKARKVKGRAGKAARSDIAAQKAGSAGPLLTRLGDTGNPLVDTGHLRASIRYQIVRAAKVQGEK